MKARAFNQYDASGLAFANGSDVLWRRGVFVKARVSGVVLLSLSFGGVLAVFGHSFVVVILLIVVVVFFPN